ncbi:MAG TPA: YdcF family protein [Gammaproteobacteria bacterium]|nr:YdcF family protein [Gammaproteobacteria bacterium]
MSPADLIWLLLKPSHLLAYTAVLGVVLWRRPIGRRLLVAAAMLVIVLGVLPTAWFVLSPLETRFLRPEDPGRVDGIVVLAGEEPARLSEVYGQPLNPSRLMTFLMLARRFPDARLVHSGDTAEPFGQSALARELLLGAGIASERIVFEDRSRTTCDSPRAVRELVKPEPAERWLLVTSAYHLPRAVACYRAAGWDVIAYPADYRRQKSPWYFGLTENLGDFDDAVHEWIGLLYYRLRGLTSELFPRPH